MSLPVLFCTSLGRRRQGRPVGGCTFAEQPDRRATDARILWRAEHDPFVLAVSAESVDPGSPDSIDLATLAVPATLIVTADDERMAICDGLRRIRLDIVAGTMREGPVRLHYHLAGFSAVEPKLLTLRRLLALQRLGRFARGLDVKEPRVARWIMMLRAHDMAAMGETQREIAAQLFGVGIGREWRTTSDSVRLRVQRLLRDAAAMVDGGYLRLLAGPGRVEFDPAD